MRLGAQESTLLDPGQFTVSLPLPDIEGMVGELDAIVEWRDPPCMSASDGGAEITNCAILEWQRDARAKWYLNAPGKL